jgi:hypothetical protein
MQVYGDEEVEDDEEFYDDATPQPRQPAEARAKPQIPPLQEPVQRYDLDVEHSIQNSTKTAQMATPSNEVPKKSFIDKFRSKKKTA